MYLVNQKKKIKRTKSSVQYYSDYIPTYRIILYGVKFVTKQSDVIKNA